MGWQISYSQCRPFHDMNKMKQRQVSAVSIVSTTDMACPAEQSSGRKQLCNNLRHLLAPQSRDGLVIHRQSKAIGILNHCYL